jgi:hypothetical protein
MKQWGRVRARESCRSGKGEARGGEGWQAMEMGERRGKLRRTVERRAGRYAPAGVGHKDRSSRERDGTRTGAGRVRAEARDQAPGAGRQGPGGRGPGPDRDRDTGKARDSDEWMAECATAKALPSSEMG